MDNLLNLIRLASKVYQPSKPYQRWLTVILLVGVGLLGISTMGLTAIGRSKATSANQKTVATVQTAKKALGKTVNFGFKRGVNEANWFSDWYYNKNGKTPPYLTLGDVQQLKKLGFDHVRLCVNADLLVPNWQHPEIWNEQVKTDYTYAIHLFNQGGLRVVANPGIEAKLFINPELTQQFEQAWGKWLASKFTPQQVAIQLVGEPPGDDPREWDMLQTQLVKAVRKVAPLHTIVTGTPLKFQPGDKGHSTARALAALHPIANDANVLYSLHFYEPNWFTHQGAKWAGMSYLQYFSGLPYPSNALSVQPLLEQLKCSMPHDPGLAWIPGVVKWYGNVPWDKARLREAMKPAADWAKANHVSILLDEFGVYNEGGVHPADRLAWISDMQELADENGWGWTYWDYGSSQFGLFNGTVGNRQLSAEESKALNLP
jgi:endoglucanase